ncbi:MAG: hypothetical protein ACREX0_14650 [Noviherbaspirillum sp.]
MKTIASSATPAAWALAVQEQLAQHPSKGSQILMARIALAARFGLSLPETLLLDLNTADCGHCLMVDIRAQYARGKRRMILVQTDAERQTLDRIALLARGIDCGPNGPEGNYRRRLYRFKTLVPNWAELRDLA